MFFFFYTYKNNKHFNSKYTFINYATVNYLLGMVSTIYILICFSSFGSTRTPTLYNVDNDI